MVIMKRFSLRERDRIRLQEEQAAIIIQTIIRRFLAVRLLKKLKSQRIEEHRRNGAAVTIQCQFRKFLALRTADQLRAIREFRERHAALVIQRFYRQQKEERQKRCEQAAVILQSHIRKFLALRRFERMKLERMERPEEEEKAAIVIQRQIRKFLAIRRTEKIRNHRAAVQRIRERHAAVVIQRFYRSQRDRRYEHAAIVLQSHIRRFLAVCHYKRMKEEVSKTTEIERAANEFLRSGIESIDRFSDHENRLAENALAMGVDDRAALTIQRSWRGFRDRQRHRDVVNQLRKLRTNVPTDDSDRRLLSIGQRIRGELPLLEVDSERLRIADFFNEITKLSPTFVEEFVKNGGVDRLIAASVQSSEICVRRLLAELALTVAKNHQLAFGKQLETTIAVLIDNLNRFGSLDDPIVLHSIETLSILSANSEAPLILKNLQFPQTISQIRRSRVPNQTTDSTMRIADETLQRINALPL